MTKIICNTGDCFSAASQPIAKPRRQNIHLYRSLPHAQGEVPEVIPKKDLMRPRSGFTGRIFVRIFGFSGFRPDFNLMSSGIVRDTRAAFSHAGKIVQEMY